MAWRPEGNEGTTPESSPADAGRSSQHGIVQRISTWPALSDTPRGAQGMSPAQEQIDAMGTSWYQLLLVIGIGLANFSESMEMGVVSPLHTALARKYDLDRAERATLPMLTYLGSIAGMLLGGPVADLWGRKKLLVSALVMICSVTCLHAALPGKTSIGVILTLRFFSGFAGALVPPVCYTLAVESSPRDVRLRLIFGIAFLGSLGYLMEALGVSWFMPFFGEAETDNFRGLCLFIGLPSAVSLPFVMLLEESPTWLGVKERWTQCNLALANIAWWNGHTQRGQDPDADGPVRQQSRIWRSLSASGTRAQTLRTLLHLYLPIFVLLMLIDACRSFYVSGAAYIAKDLFELTRIGNEEAIPPTAMNVVASLSPLVGLVVGERAAFLGVRGMLVVSSGLAGASMFLLSSQEIRQSSWTLFILVLVYKLSFGPICTCISLMKVEAFPTEIRSTLSSWVGMIARVLCALGPMLVEALKPTAAASSWPPKNLSAYLASLAATALGIGILTLLVPARCLGSSKLTDYPQVDEKEGSMAEEGAAAERIIEQAKSVGALNQDYGSMSKGK